MLCLDWEVSKILAERDSFGRDHGGAHLRAHHRGRAESFVVLATLVDHPTIPRGHASQTAANFTGKLASEKMSCVLSRDIFNSPFLFVLANNHFVMILILNIKPKKSTEKK